MITNSHHLQHLSPRDDSLGYISTGLNGFDIIPEVLRTNACTLIPISQKVQSPTPVPGVFVVWAIGRTQQPDPRFNRPLATTQ
jgi:hypothetical protein